MLSNHRNYNSFITRDLSSFSHFLVENKVGQAACERIKSSLLSGGLNIIMGGGVLTGPPPSHSDNIQTCQGN